jgi:hypothetical protein
MARLMGFQILLCVTIAIVWALSGRASPAETLRLVTDVSLGSVDDIRDNKAPGFNIEVLKQVFAAMGQDVSFEGFPPNRLDDDSPRRARRNDQRGAHQRARWDLFLSGRAVEPGSLGSLYSHGRYRKAEVLVVRGSRWARRRCPRTNPRLVRAGVACVSQIFARA